MILVHAPKVFPELRIITPDLKYIPGRWAFLRIRPLSALIWYNTGGSARRILSVFSGVFNQSLTIDNSFPVAGCVHFIDTPVLRPHTAFYIR